MRLGALAIAVAAMLSATAAFAQEPDGGTVSDAGANPDAPAAAEAGVSAQPEPAPPPKPAPALKPAPHPAPTAKDRASAKRYFEAGNQAYEAGQYLLAARAYEEAYRLDPLPAITFSVAQAYRLQYYQDHDLEHLRRALALYHQYLDNAPHGNRRGHATTNIEAIESILGAVKPEAPEAPAPAPSKPEATTTQLMVVSHTPHASARIDDGEAMSVPFAHAVEPGMRTVHVEAPGYASARSQWLAVKGRLVVANVELHPLPATIHVKAPPGVSVRLDGLLVTRAELSVPAGVHVLTMTERGHLPAVRRLSLARGQNAKVDVARLDTTDQRVTATWTLVGAGTLAVAGGVTTVLAIAAENRVREYDNGIGHVDYAGSDLADRNSSLDARDRFRTASWALFGTAAALGVTGGLLWWLDEPGRQSAAGGVTPVIGPDSAGASWHTAF